MAANTMRINMNDSIELQTWRLAELLPPVTEATEIVFADLQMAVDELRLRIQALIMELESLRREKQWLTKVMNGES